MSTKHVLISGASIAGLTAAYWMNKLDYTVTIVETAAGPRRGGAAVNIVGPALEAARRMGILEQLRANSLCLEMWEFKNAADVTEKSMLLRQPGAPPADNADIEIERDKLIDILLDTVKEDVTFLFNNSVAALAETATGIQVSFKNGQQQVFDLVLGCDGLHSGIRKIWFGEEAQYSHFLELYFSITIVNKRLIKPNTGHMYNVPGKSIMLNTYNDKTDIVFCFVSEKEIAYDYRDAAQQSAIVVDHFTGVGWKAPALLEEVKHAGTAYFDKVCQIKMPAWSSGRVALIGDAAYCASPAAGCGASLAMAGAVALADAVQQYPGDLQQAFQAYEDNLRPFVETTQDMAERNVRESFVPRTEAEIRKRYEEGFAFFD